MNTDLENELCGEQHRPAADNRSTAPTVTVVGDFADARSFLASQRVTQLVSLGLLVVRWLAVESDRSRPMPGWPLDDAVAQAVSELSTAGEQVPASGIMVPNSRAASAAYAEAVADGVADEMRRALFDALWNDHRRVDDPEVIRSIVFAVLDAKLHSDLDERLRSNQPLVPLGDPNILTISRRLGFTVSTGRGPLTRTGQRRLDTWRQFWEDHGTSQLPLLVTETGEQLPGDRALRWLADRLPRQRFAANVEMADTCHPHS